MTAGSAGRILYANPACEKIFGYSAAELVGMPLSKLMPERYRAAHEAGMRRYLAGGEPRVIGRTVELEGLRSSGEEFPLELSLGVSRHETDPLFISIIRDITERKRAEQAMHREVSYVRLLEAIAAASNESATLAQALPTCLSLVAQQSAWPVAHAFLVTCSETGLRLISSGTWYLVEPSKFEKLRDALEAWTFSLGEGLPGRVLKSGRADWVADILSDGNFPRKHQLLAYGLRSALAFPILAGREVVAILEFFSSAQAIPPPHLLQIMEHVGAQIGRVAERERSERMLRELNLQLEGRVAERTQELQRARDEAVGASRAKSVFLANMSHELRTPLNAILGYTELIQEELVDAGLAGLAGDLSKVQLSAKHLLSLITDILDISKIEAGKLELWPSETELAPLLEEAMALIRPTAEKNRNQICLECTTPPGYLYADKMRVQQILANLLSNAAKFTEDGTITIRCEGYRDESGKEWIRLSVSDTGIGISEDEQKRLFQKFQQFAPSPRRSGTGLGLAISRLLAQAMGGEIDVVSSPGSGSTFTLTIPAGTAPLK